MTDFQRYTDTVQEHTVTGDLRVYKGFPSALDDGATDILVWLPSDYESNNRRYPVIYMHDGQNVFDAHTSNSGEWGADETMTALYDEGLSAIVVGIPNLGARRSVQYSPYDFTLNGQNHQGLGDDYIRWIVNQLKPLIDRSFSTQPEAAHTGIVGSSMGGLISLYGYVRYPQVFGLCGAFSTAYWFGENGLLQTVREKATPHGRIYLDVGTREGEVLMGWNIAADDQDVAYVQGVRDLRDTLIEKGYILDYSLLYMEAEGAIHRENEWAQRLPDALRFLLSQN